MDNDKVNIQSKILSLSFSKFIVHVDTTSCYLPVLAVGPTFDLGAFRKGLEVIVPQPLTIRVPITGYPTPVAKWTFGEKELSTADERVSMVTKPSYTELTVAPSVRPDKGTYNLQLENDVSSVSGEIEVNVIGNQGTCTTRLFSQQLLSLFDVYNQHFLSMPQCSQRLKGG